MMSDSLWNDIVFRNNAGMKVAVVDEEDDTYN